MNYSNPFLVLYSCTSVLCCLNSWWGTGRVFKKFKNRCKFVCMYERSFKWSYQCPQDSCTSKCQSYSQHVWLGGIRFGCCISISTNHWKTEKSHHQNNLYLMQSDLCLYDYMNGFNNKKTKTKFVKTNLCPLLVIHQHLKMAISLRHTRLHNIYGHL